MPTKVQNGIINRTNKYGVVYDVPGVTAKSMVSKGLIEPHTNFYGQTHGYKLTTAGWAAKREMKG